MTIFGQIFEKYFFVWNIRQILLNEEKSYLRGISQG